MNEKLMGVFAPITTPFTADGTVDYSGLEHNVRAYAKSGLKGSWPWAPTERTKASPMRRSSRSWRSSVPVRERTRW